MQRRGLRRSTAPVGSHVVVCMGDPAAADVAAARAGPPLAAVHVDVPDSRLPLARARNAGAERAIESGADLLVFLDVDCVPAPGMVRRYVECAGEDRAPRLLCGPVAYLPPPPPAGYDLDRLSELADPHPARPHPGENETLENGDPRLFWSLSFAVRPAVWERIGGFCEEYRGYGGEDTDFGQCAAAAGVRLDWTGGAVAHHQFHPVSDPPVEHVDDVVANARIFFRRWGWWPMSGWLTEFQRLGLAHFDPADGWRHGPSGD
ncbi:galactosyltransferase-related protein [Blastococcus sp. CT_GayMR16]|uniref:glycosyltransferase family 2 protein n=1 Tax=Blastococcus sp. CT_GayMR16 TaxID=2559607 RepID=UPI001ADDD3F2|nr:galactosyltransferase-related protein [Blastococcus sp. CT_GayMR16]